MHTTRELLIKTDAVALSGTELNTGVSLSPRGKEVLELFMNGYQPVEKALIFKTAYTPQR